MKPLFACAAIVAFTFIYETSAQRWLELHYEGAGFHEVRVAFEEEFGHLSPDLKGRGIKQFRRWEWFHEPRVNADGFYPEGVNLWDIFTKEKENANRSASSRSSQPWQLLGYDQIVPQSYNPGYGRVNVIAVNPQNGNVIYAGTPSGGLWKSTDAGQSWSPLTDDFPSLGVSAIAIDPTNPQRIFIGTGDGDASDTYGTGVLKSEDGGLTWSHTSLAFNLSENVRSFKLIIDPTNPQVIFYASNKGLYRTQDGGNNWSVVQTGTIRDVVFKPGSNSVLYSVTQSQFFRSVDGGSTFQGISDGTPPSSGTARIAMAVTPANPDYIYLLVANSSNYGFRGLWRSIDGGTSFELRTEEPNILGWSMDGGGTGGQGWYDLAIAASPVDPDLIFTGGVNLWSSPDGGESFEIVAHWVFSNNMTTPYVHADIHYLGFHQGKLFCGSDGGAFVSSNNGQTFSDISKGLVINQFYKIGTSPNIPDLVLGGTQDNGTNRWNGSNWTHVLGADGMECDIHPTDPNIMYALIQYGGLRRSTNGGQNWQNIVNDIPETGRWVTPFLVSPANPNFLYLGYTNVWRSSNNGFTWIKISDFQGSTRLVAMDVCAVNPNIIYAATPDRIYRTNNSGLNNNWQMIGQWLGANITAVKTDPANGNRVWVTFSGFNESLKVLYSEDAGITWQNLSLNLPNIPVNDIEIDFNNQHGLYIGTDVGVYYKNDLLSNWLPWFDNMPNVIVKELEIITSSQKIYAATYGRGVWYNELFVTNDEAITADFGVNQRKVCQGVPVNFTDLSLYASSRTWEFPGGNPLTSSDHSPVITYDAPGIYPVTITAFNANAQATEIRTDYITVHPMPGPTPPYSEGFESVNDLETMLWTFNHANQIPWALTTEVAFSGNKSIWIENHSMTFPEVAEIISEPIDLSNLITGEMTYKVAYARKMSGNDDKLRIYFSTDCGETWTLRKTLRAQTNLPSAPQQTEPFFPNGPDQWKHDVVNILNVHKVEGFRFKFTWENDGGNNLFIDEINISGTVGMEEKTTRGIQLYPNPASSFVVVSWPVNGSFDFLRIMDVSGRIIHDQRCMGGSAEIDLTHFPRGSYFIRLQGKNEMPIVTPFIIE
jgi:PKD repeat protein